SPGRAGRLKPAATCTSCISEKHRHLSGEDKWYGAANAAMMPKKMIGRNLRGISAKKTATSSRYQLSNKALDSPN
ncbi:MAG TPA: hypothetical protein VJ417_14450, partial [Candidatus Glassbacteria bacterium]|nr:hypothetical protein [Candidatus Glassbacteria bacterium]